MPQIIVMADARDRAVMFTERVNVSDFESHHFQTQLVERIGWAVEDAQAVEQDPPAGNEGPVPERELGVVEEAPSTPGARATVSGAQPVS